MKIIYFTLLAFILFSCRENNLERLTIIAGENDTTIFSQPFGMCSDAEGNLYVADAGHNQIRKVSPRGETEIFAGTGEAGQKDGPALEAMFNYPSGICTDGKGNFYIAGFGGQNIRKIDSDGNVTTLAGTGIEGYLDGPGDIAMFSSPRGLCIDSDGNLYVGDCWNHRIRKITPDGFVSTFAGGGRRGELVVNDWKDGQDTIARFDAPCGMAIDDKNNIYVADANNNCIRKITVDAYVSTLAGIGGKRGSADGLPGESILNCPTELVVNKDGIVYFSDTYGNHIRVINKDGFASTLINDTDSLGSPRGITIRGNKLFFIEYSNRQIQTYKLAN